MPRNVSRCKKMPVILMDFFDFINCNYLPSLGGDIPCFYEPVFCRDPPEVMNATVKTNSSRSFEHLLYDRAEYSCDEGFEMAGNNSIPCTYSGQWSTPPRCLLKPIIKSRLNPITVVLSILLILLSLLVLAFAVRYKIQSRRNLKTWFEIRKLSGYIKTS